MQEWIEKLADKSTEGMLTPEERDEYEALVRVGKLGLFLGAKTFGRRGSRAKVCLILDRQKYRYQKFCCEIFFNRMIQGGYLLLQLLACPNASDTPSAPPKDLARSGIDS